MDLPWKFPDRGEAVREHMRVFQGLPPDARWQAIADTVAAGFALRRESVREVPELLEAALRLAEAARRCGLAHALVGGLGVAFWTETRFARQIDLLVDLP